MKKLLFALTLSLIIPAATSCCEGKSKRPSNQTLAIGTVAAVLTIGGAVYYYYNQPSAQESFLQTPDKPQIPAQTKKPTIYETAGHIDQKTIEKAKPLFQRPTPQTPTEPSQNTATETPAVAPNPKPVLIDKATKPQPTIITEPKKTTPAVAATSKNKSFLDCLHATASSTNWDQFAKNNLEQYDY